MGISKHPKRRSQRDHRTVVKLPFKKLAVFQLALENIERNQAKLEQIYAESDMDKAHLSDYETEIHRYKHAHNRLSVVISTVLAQLNLRGKGMRLAPAIPVVGVDDPGSASMNIEIADHKEHVSVKDIEKKVRKITL